jgi:hypothetical protein
MCVISAIDNITWGGFFFASNGQTRTIQKGAKLAEREKNRVESRGWDETGRQAALRDGYSWPMDATFTVTADGRLVPDRNIFYDL